jgi:hypothetical protein
MHDHRLPRAVILALLLALPTSALGAPSYVGVGTASNTTAYALTITPSVPTSAVTNDILVVVMRSALNAAITCTANCGSPAYAEVATQFGGTSVRMAVWYRRVQSGESGAVPTPTFRQSGTASKFTGRVFVFRCVDTTTALDVVSGSGIVAESAATTYTGDAVSTTVNDSMVLFAVSSADDNTWGTWGGGINNGAYTANSASTIDNSIALGWMNGGNGAAGAKSAPTMVQLTLGGDAGHSLTFALRASTDQACQAPLGSGGMMGFWP